MKIYGINIKSDSTTIVSVIAAKSKEAVIEILNNTSFIKNADIVHIEELSLHNDSMITLYKNSFAN